MNRLDELIRIMSPGLALKRRQHEMKLQASDKMQRDYEAAKHSRFNKDWHPVQKSPQQEINESLVWLRNRSRDLVKNNGYATNIARVIPNNVVGTGIMPNFSIQGNKSLPNKLKELWKKWAENVVCDVDGRCTFYAMQHLAMRTIVVSGEALIVRRYGNSKLDIPLKLQVLPGDYIDTTRYELETADGGSILYGIAFNSDGSRKGYYLYDKHPNEFATQSRFVPAKDVIHLYEMEEPGQFRGLPFSKSTILNIKDLDDYQFAERVRAKVAASFTAFVTQPDERSIDASEWETIEPNSIMRLRPGEDVKFGTPPPVNGQENYVRNELRGISAGNGLSYESMTNDYSNVNFSSGRMGWIENGRNTQSWQWFIIVPHLCSGVMGWWLEALQFKGLLAFNKKVNVTWTAPRREMIDPLKETKARQEGVNAGFISRQEVIREDGYNPEEVNEEIVKDMQFQRENGLNFGAFEEIQLKGNAPE